MTNQLKNYIIMKYILTASSDYGTPLRESAFLPCIPANAKQELCRENWKGEKMQAWVIELKTIKDVEDLQKWAQENYEDCTGLIFLPKDTFDKYPMIEIYDDYRE